MTTSPIAVRQVSPLQIVGWLGAGWADLCRCGWYSLGQGLALGFFGGLLIWLGHDRFWLLAGAFSGFLVVAPVLATSLYAMSRALQHQQPITKRLLLDTWFNWQQYRKSDPNAYWSILRFGTLLGLAATGWVICSAALITLMAPGQVNTPIDFLHQIVLARQGLAFELWLMLGGILAAPIFASSVVAIPLLLDRHIGLAAAVEVSWRCVLANPVSLVLWAAVIMVLTALGMAFLMVGLAVVVPLLGHASWHAYQDLVNTDELPLRQLQVESA
jgi:uncharacterized membrane protein